MSVTRTPDDVELPWSAKFLLWTIEEMGGAVRRSTLLDETGMAPSTLDRALDRLESADVVRRDRDGDDLRFVRVQIVEKS